jgi:hypothetical protein
MGDGDTASGWQGAAMPSAIIAASDASAVTSRPQGRPKGLSSSVVLGSGSGAGCRAGAGRHRVERRGTRSMSDVASAGVAIATMTGRRRSRTFGEVMGLRACEGVGDAAHPGAGSRQGTAAGAAGALGARRSGPRPSRRGRCRLSAEFDPSSKPGRTPACAAKSAIAPPIRPSAPTRIQVSCSP